MRFTLCVATMAVCLIALQSTADSTSEADDDLSSPQQLNSGGHTGSGTNEGQQVSGDSGTSQSGVGQKTPPGQPSTGQLASPGPSGSGGAADKTVTTTTTSTAANADAANPLSEADQSQQQQGPAQQGQAQGTENNPIQDSGPTHNNPGGVPPNELKTVNTTTTKPVTELGDTGSEIGDRDRVAEEEQTHKAGPTPNVPTDNAASKQITPTPSRGTVDGVPQHNRGQPSPTPDERTPVVREPNTASSSGDEVHAPELPLEPHTETGVSENLTKTQPAQEQTPPLSVKPQTPPSTTTTVKQNVTPLVPSTSTSTVPNKDTSVNNNPPTTLTVGELKVLANKPAAKTPTDPTNGDKETMPSKQSITSTSEPAQVESTAHLTPLPKLSKALQSLENKDTSIGTLSLFALAAVASLVVMAVAPTF